MGSKCTLTAMQRGGGTLASRASFMRPNLDGENRLFGCSDPEVSPACPVSWLPEVGSFPSPNLCYSVLPYKPGNDRATWPQIGLEIESSIFFSFKLMIFSFEFCHSNRKQTCWLKAKDPNSLCRLNPSSAKDPKWKLSNSVSTLREPQVLSQRASKLKNDTSPRWPIYPRTLLFNCHGTPMPSPSLCTVSHRDAAMCWQNILEN